MSNYRRAIVKIEKQLQRLMDSSVLGVGVLAPLDDGYSLNYSVNGQQKRMEFTSISAGETFFDKLRDQRKKQEIPLIIIDI